MTTTNVEQSWGADFFGELNAMPPDTVQFMDHVLVPMSTEAGFQSARRALLRDLHIGPGSSVLEAGCGTGGALPDLLALTGADGHITGIDPTAGFIDLSRQRAQAAGAVRAHFALGDIRNTEQATDSFDAAFCEKVLIHAGPAHVALAELVRVTRPAGRVGALEWLPYFAISSTHPELVARFNGMLRQAVYDYNVSTNLPGLLHDAGLTEVQSRAHLASATDLDDHPFWRAFLIDQLPMFVHAGLLEQAEADGFAEDLEGLSRRGDFTVAVVIRTAVGTKRPVKLTGVRRPWLRSVHVRLARSGG